MQLGHCGRLGLPCVVIENIDEVEIDCLLDLALVRGAILQDGGEERYVIQFPGTDEAVVLTEDELRQRVSELQTPPCPA